MRKIIYASLFFILISIFYCSFFKYNGITSIQDPFIGVGSYVSGWVYDTISDEALDGVKIRIIADDLFYDKYQFCYIGAEGKTDIDGHFNIPISSTNIKTHKNHISESDIDSMVIRLTLKKKNYVTYRFNKKVSFFIWGTLPSDSQNVNSNTISSRKVNELGKIYLKKEEEN